VTRTAKVANILLFLGVEADDRVASRPKFGFEFADLGKLLIAVRHRLQRLLLLRFAATIIVLPQQLAGWGIQSAMYVSRAFCMPLPVLGRTAPT